MMSLTLDQPHRKALASIQTLDPSLMALGILGYYLTVTCPFPQPGSRMLIAPISWTFESECKVSKGKNETSWCSFLVDFPSFSHMIASIF